MTEKDKQVELSSDRASGRDPDSSTLIPMLIAGIVLVIIGAVIVMMFV